MLFEAALSHSTVRRVRQYCRGGRNGGEGRRRRREANKQRVSEPYFDDLQHSDDDEDAEEPEDDAVRSVACESTPCYTHHSDAQREEDHTNDVLDDEGSDPGNAAQSECVRVSNRDMLRVVRERHVETHDTQPRRLV